MMPTKTGTHFLAAAILSLWYIILDLINHKKTAAIAPPRTGEITQLAAIFPIVGQLTAANPAAAIPAPITPPTTECVVDTGAPTQVARLTHKAAANRAESIANIKIVDVCML